MFNGVGIFVLVMDHEMRQEFVWGSLVFECRNIILKDVSLLQLWH